MEVMLKVEDEMYDKMFCTSDTHFGHNKDFIFKTRGYEDVHSMNVDMIDTINMVVGPGGILLHFGDFCLNTNIESYIDLIRSLKIKELWLIDGNHNNPHRNFNLYEETDGITCKVIKFGKYLTFRHKRKEFICFHFPIAVWDDMGRGSMHLCGHSHGGYKLSRPEDTTHKILDCGWCVHRKPLSMLEIETIMNKKGVNNLHHA